MYWKNHAEMYWKKYHAEQSWSLEIQGFNTGFYTSKVVISDFRLNNEISQ